MKKINIIQKNTEYNRIIQNIKPFKYKDYMIFLEKDKNINNYHFGITISKKICNAVTRNKIKRQIKNILDEKRYQNGFNCIIMIRKSLLEKNFEERKQVLIEALNYLDIYKKESTHEK